MIKNVEPISSTDFNKGLVTRSDFLKGDINASPDTMDVTWKFDASLHKRFGHSSTNSVSIGSSAMSVWTLDSSGSLSTNLSAYWKLDESSGTRQPQIGGISLLDANTTNSIVGIRNNAALLVAVGSNYLLGQTASPIETGNVNFSMSTWAYLNSTDITVNRTLISKRDPSVDTATVLLLHMDGVDGSTTFSDSSPSARGNATVNGAVEVDTAQSKFGGASALFGGGYLTYADSTDYDMGTGDFTIDFWVRFNTVSVTQNMCGANDSTASNTLQIRYTTEFQITLQNTAYGFAWSPAINTWYHVAVTRFSGTLRAFIDGNSIGSASSSDNISVSTVFAIGSNDTGASPLDGWMDEFRMTKGIARWTANFTPPTKPYQVNEFEYWLFISSSGLPTFQVSSTGSASTASVSSAGALNTSTWYNIIAWHSNNSHIGISVNNVGINTSSYTGGVRVGSAPFVLGALSNGIAGRPTGFLDARQDETGFWKKVLDSNDRSNLYGGGTGNTYSAGASAFAWASFDFGASNIRWLTVSAGTGIVASSNRGTTFVTVATNRTENYQSLTRSKNVLIATSDAYDPTLYWAGSVGTFAVALAPNSAPAAKFSVNYQGFLILLNFMNSNNVIRNRGFAYADENLQLTDTWQNSFDIPSSADDEITASFILYKFLYVSTRYTIYRVAFTGGNPDWTYLKVKDWGFVPRTVSIVSLKGGGQVAIGLDWNRRIRIFDGFEDLFASDNIENDNMMCDFAMDKISFAGSGLLVSHGVLDVNNQEYVLNVAIGANSTQTTNSIVMNCRSLAWYPYSNQQFQTMCTALSNNQSALMAFDRSGFCWIMNSGYLDYGTVPINEHYDSPPIFSKTPEAVAKGKELDVFFAPVSCGIIYAQDRTDLSNQYSPMRPLGNRKGETAITGTENAIKVLRTLNVPSTYNTWQFRITSSAGTQEPWQLDRLDYFQQGFGIGQGR